ncbi:DUF721 domain-containing protein [Fulvivirga sediminis]|uniref:DUF721 domain-containing protein n=1 Tax=Fulvivirga sediminis TaxID=2803949 RepID=A0A937JZB3_9BACT|nr:DUF721 domain-containing protein [Fulvivirga sediminis]MBL3655001.1 DUF721 domain-containing protein [Fulvivirga sediminis]
MKKRNFDKFDKRKSDISSVKEAIDSLLDTYRLKGRFDEARLVESWAKLMGNTIANRTGKIFIKDQVLFVEILSAPLKHQLNHSKMEIMKILEKEFGHKVINEILFY